MLPKPPHPVYVMKDEESVYSLLFMNDKMLAGNKNGKISEWNLTTFRNERTLLNIGTSACMSMKYFNNILFTQDKLGHVKLWMAHDSSWSLTKTVNIDYNGFCKIDITDDLGGILAHPSHKSVVTLYSLNSHSNIMSFVKHEDESISQGEVMGLKIIHIKQQPYIIAGYENGDLSLWDFRTQHVIGNLKTAHCLLDVDFSESSMNGLYSNVTNNVVGFKIDDSCQLVKTQNTEISNPGVSTIKIHPNNKIVALGCWDGGLRILSWKSLRPLAVLNAHSGEILDICFSTGRDTFNIAVGGNDRKISLWNLYNTETTQRLMNE